jgi:fimbrial isopeptide formation D2 family protein/LPXTG-motif cell wall-anchored protein
MGKFFSRLAAGVGAIALMTAGLLGAASPASADPTTPPAPSLANIDPTQPTSLTIHKYDGNPGQAGDGTAIEDTSSFGNGLEGVVFTITPVTAKNGTPIDLTTYTGWELIDGATVADVTADDSVFTLGTSTTATTLAGGTVTKDLPMGFYLVTETDPGNNNISTPVVPFLVSLPYPNTADWIYDVHVYPKNVVDDTDITKTVANPSQVVLPDGTVVTNEALVDWTITVPVPAASAYTQFVVTDPLDSRLTYDSIEVTIGGAELVEGTDYTVTDNIVVTFTSSGLGKLVAGTQVVLVLTTEVHGSGIIPNTVSAVVNNFETALKPADVPSTNWAPLKVIKQDIDNKKLLKDAEFEIYLSDKTTQVGTAAYTTDSNGEINVTLWVGNNDDITKTYWLKETKAPAGYTTPTGDAAWTQVDLVAGATEVVTKTIDNEKRTGPGLPLTGGQGTMLFLIAGVAIIGAAGGTLIFRKARA